MQHLFVLLLNHDTIFDMSILQTHVEVRMSSVYRLLSLHVEVTSHVSCLSGCLMEWVVLYSGLKADFDRALSSA